MKIDKPDSKRPLCRKRTRKSATDITAAATEAPANSDTVQEEAVPAVRYVTLKKEASSEFIERKSLFIGHAAPAPDEQTALDFIARKKSEYSDASHNVYAYVTDGGARARYSDAGEPGGTAGLPSLEVIKKTGLDDAVIVVTRYFGGVLLGAGGLTRAYSAAARLAVEAAGIAVYENYTAATLTCGYSDYQKLQTELTNFGAEVDTSDFADIITLSIAVREEIYNDFTERVADLTSGRAILEITGSRLGASEITD